ncbi:aldo/keto reductase [Formosa sp. 3Alg 14/1]|uniref:aldo/keto reductase n=1 Tax=Formosa sp. 3Alg 14/1 TaxID=3382190 RepID=UPI0039BECE93
MKYTTLPHSDIKVSKLCLGTMTWGNQNTQEEGFEQMNYAVEQGINFFDTAELYPVPAQESTYAETERIIGKWLKQTRKREDIVLASKIAGTGDYTAHIRTNGFAPEAIESAIENSLKRLQTDYIDLFQLHWPERESNFFGTRDYKHNPNDPWEDNFNEVLNSLDKAIQAGKIRNIGISNEKAWGAMRYLEESKYNAKPRMKTIQNSYSLINRGFETDLAEIAMREGLGLLAYSPMAFGVLSGKYVEGLANENSRLNLYPRFSRYSSVNCTKAVTQYLQVAKDHGLSLAQMSLAFVTQQPFVTSNIIGASKMEQLKENIASIEVDLTDEIIAEINKIHEDIPNPAT